MVNLMLCIFYHNNVFKGMQHMLWLVTLRMGYEKATASVLDTLSPLLQTNNQLLCY